MKTEMICSGFGGQGVLTTGLILAEAAMSLRQNATFTVSPIGASFSARASSLPS